MAITDKLRDEFYRVLQGQQIEDNQSSILSNPLFQGTKDTNFISAINKFNNLSIVDNIGFRNRKLIFYNSNKGAVIGVFGQNDTLVYQLDKHFTDGQNPQQLYKFLKVKINDLTGQIYGLVEVAGKVNFFIFNNIVEQVGIVDDDIIESQLFYNTLFNIEDEIVEDNKVTIGNSLFGQLRTNPDTPFGFNVDQTETSLYSFTIYDSTNKQAYFIQFQTDLGPRNPNEDTTWNYNEIINLSQGGIGQATFDGVALLDIFTGTRNISTTEQSLGSIVLSTQKDGTQAVEADFSFGVNSTDPRSYSETKNKIIYRGKVPGLVNYNFTVANKSNFFDNWLSKIQAVIDSNPISIDYSGSILIKAKTTKQRRSFGTPTNIKININKQIIDQMLNANDIQLVARQSIIDSGITEEDGAAFRNYIIAGRITLEVDGNDIISENTENKKEKLFVVKDSLNKYIIQNDIFYTQRVDAARDDGSTFSKNYDVPKATADITEEITVNGKRLQQSVDANTTSQILIDKVDGSDELVYKIVQIENNSYNATDPVFLSPTKFYIPLKSKETNAFYVAEFDGDTGRGTAQVNRFLNDIGIKNYTDAGGDTYTQTLLSPDSITKVNINGADIPASRYALNGDQIQITQIKLNDSIIIEYVSTTGQPKQINLVTSTLGEDVFIKGVSDFEELGASTRTIVGVGDDSFEGTQNNVFGFNLYRSKSNVDYDAISESTQPITDIKMKHIILLRQKNIIFFEGYNEDYTKVVKWIQIYPDSFKPYTYLPYNNPNKFFSLERLNVNKDENIANTVFDREFLDVNSSGSLILASTLAEITDLNNNDNNIVSIYGATNVELFKYNRDIIKSELENLSINFQLTARVEDNLQEQLIYKNLSDKFVKLFTQNTTTNWSDFEITKLVITYTDGTKIEENITNQEYITRVGNVLHFGITLLKKSGKDLKEIKLQLKDGSDFGVVDLTQNPCAGNLLNISYDIFLQDNTDIFQQATKGG